MHSDVNFFYKKGLLIVVGLCLFASVSSAATVTLAWDKSTGCVSGYRLYVRETSLGAFEILWEGSQNSCVFDDVDFKCDIVYEFVVRAFNSLGESGSSNLVAYEKPSPEPEPDPTLEPSLTPDPEPAPDLSPEPLPDPTPYPVPDPTPETDMEPDSTPDQPPEPGDDNDSEPSCDLTPEPDSAITPDPLSDTDGDGIVDDHDLDDDNDGIPDGWENYHGLNPMDPGDAFLDLDGDGLDNLGEFEMGYDPSFMETGPGRALLVEPVNDGQCIDSSGILISTYSNGASKKTHVKSFWQISETPSFDNLVLNVLSDVHVVQLPIPEMVLKSNFTYWARVRYIDRPGLVDRYWPWSQPVSFDTCTMAGGDDNGNQIPDDQEPEDILPHEMAVTFANGSGTISLGAVSNVSTIDSLKCIEKTDCPAQDSIPGDLIWGTFAFRIVPENFDQPVVVRLQISKPLPENVVWYKYDAVSGWQDFSDFVSFSEDRTCVSIELIDGGFGDADGVVNGVIVDPSGPVVLTPEMPSDEPDAVNLNLLLLRFLSLIKAAAASVVLFQ